MSIHRSLQTKGALVRSRNVLTRYERILELRKDGKWEDDADPYGLPKVRVKISRAGKKSKKVEEVEEVAEEGEATEEAS